MLKPLTARSVVASTLLGITPPRLPAAALVASGEQFGVAPGTTRVALSRMVDAGELTLDNGTYALAGTLLERHARQEQGRHPVTKPWTGEWRMAIVTATGRDASARAALRVTMGKLRMAELREGVWLRPDNLALPATIDDCTMHSTRPDTLDADALFGLREWSTTADVLLRALARTQPHLERLDASMLGETFVIAAATTRHLTLDPLLPPQLLPTDWPGGELRSRYDAYQEHFANTWRNWYRSSL